MTSCRAGALAALLACLLRVTVAHAAEGGVPIQFGVLPNVSARVVIATYQPMRQLLERVFGRPVEVVTAPDFKSFVQRTLAGEYDLVVTAAHLARLAQVDGSHVLLGAYTPAMKGLLVVAKDRPVSRLQDLHGATIAVANPQSLVGMRGLQWLGERGLNAGTEYTMVKAANEDSLGRMLLNGSARLAILSNVELRQMPEEIRRQLAVHTDFAEVPGFVWLAHRRLVPGELAALRAQLKSLDRTDEGRRFFAATGIESWREIDESEMALLDPVIPQTRRILGIIP